MIAGIGNVIRAEACFAAGDSPWRRVGRLEPGEARGIVDAAARIMAATLATGERPRRLCGRAPVPAAATGSGPARAAPPASPTGTRAVSDDSRIDPTLAVLMNRMLIRTITICLVAFVVMTAGAAAAPSPRFRPAVQISTPLPHPYYSDPGIALRDGKRVAVWTKIRFGTRSWVQAAALDGNGDPGPVSSVEATTDSGYDDDPAVALSGAGAAAIVWQGEGSSVVGPSDARLAVLGADDVLGPAQTLGQGADPVVGYPSTGDGLLAWSGVGGMSIAPVDPLGSVGGATTIPLEGGASRAFDPTIELGPGGAGVYWSAGPSVFEARVSELGEPESVREVLPPNETGYRDLSVSGDLLVALRDRGRPIDLVCVPLGGGIPVTIDSGSAASTSPIRFGSLDVDAAGTHGLIGWVRRQQSGRRVAKVATVDDRCRASRTTSLPSPGRRANDVQVSHDGRSPLALVAGGGGLESVGLSRSGEVRGSRRIANTKPFSKKAESRTPVTQLELVTEPGTRPTAVWAQSHRGPGQTIAASIAR
ncbi:MAG: hypothetical protein KJ006_04870 [Thermoleophilia bacterium]|nr:hypothetical protein [Thermoleophilia bacterium]